MRITKLLRISSFQIIIGSFLAVILTGTLLLMLPVSSAEGVATSFGDALFTATSAVCVTGLVVHDTFRYWSLFGQLCILLLIQIGGLGTITLATVVTMLAGRKMRSGNDHARHRCHYAGGAQDQSVSAKHHERCGIR